MCVRLGIARLGWAPLSSAQLYVCHYQYSVDVYSVTFREHMGRLAGFALLGSAKFGM